ADGDLAAVLVLDDDHSAHVALAHQPRRLVDRRAGGGAHDVAGANLRDLHASSIGGWPVDPDGGRPLRPPDAGIFGPPPTAPIDKNQPAPGSGWRHWRPHLQERTAMPL